MNQLGKWENKIVCGDTLETLKLMPSEIISCVMTSPPYWSLRDYKVEGQVGLEKTYQEWLEKMWAVMDEIWRVLRKDGAVWINLGDTYSNDGVCGGGSPVGDREYRQYDKMAQEKMKGRARQSGIPIKSLTMLPERFAIGCLERNWTIRNKCVWAKPNPMPCSAKDRFTTTWEYLYFMVKNTKPLWFYNTKTRKAVDRKPSPEKLQENRDWTWRDEHKRKKVSLWRSYSGFFDLDRVRRPHTTAGNGFYGMKRSLGLGHKGSKRNIGRQQARENHCYTKMHPAGKNPGDVITTDQIAREHGYDPDDICPVCGRSWKRHASPNALDRKEGIRRNFIPCSPSAGANPGDFMVIPTQPSKLPHYASYPEKLCETPLKAGCPRWICRSCGKARVRVNQRKKDIPSYNEFRGQWNRTQIEKFSGQAEMSRKGLGEGGSLYAYYEKYPQTHEHLGYSFCSCLCPVCGQADCKCGAKWRPGIVLDPFAGTGKTCVVAKKLGLSWLYIDLKLEYCEMAKKEIDRVTYQEKLL